MIVFSAFIQSEHRGTRHYLSTYLVSFSVLENKIVRKSFFFSVLFMPYNKSFIDQASSVNNIYILADILLIARIFPRPCGARKNTAQLAKYPRVLYDKPSNKVYIINMKIDLINYHPMITIKPNECNLVLVLYFIIPLLCHFTIFGQENAQNMRLYYTVQQSKYGRDWSFR